MHMRLVRDGYRANDIIFQKNNYEGKQNATRNKTIYSA